MFGRSVDTSFVWFLFNLVVPTAVGCYSVGVGTARSSGTCVCIGVREAGTWVLGVNVV